MGFCYFLGNNIFAMTDRRVIKNFNQLLNTQKQKTKKTKKNAELQNGNQKKCQMILESPTTANNNLLPYVNF